MTKHTGRQDMCACWSFFSNGAVCGSSLLKNPSFRGNKVGDNRTNKKNRWPRCSIPRVPCFRCLFFRNSGVFFWGFIISWKKKQSNLVLSFYGMLKFGFYRGFAWVIYISVFSLATSANSVFVGLLSSWLKTKIFRITCVIVISPKVLFGAFGI